MAEAPKTARPRKFAPVKVKTIRRGGAKMKPATGTLSPTGLCLFNKQGLLDLMGLARKVGANPDNFELWFGADEDTRTIAVYAEPAGTEGCGRFRRTKRGGASFHLGDVFDEYPKCRPETTVDCSVTADVDQDGRPCLVISVNGALQHL
jgi:hypothetical protein